VEDCEPPNSGCCDSNCKFKVNGTLCSAARGICDKSEYCTGTAAACPADVRQSNTFLCRAAKDTACDTAEYP
jgi:hypothetical protein